MFGSVHTHIRTRLAPWGSKNVLDLVSSRLYQKPISETGVYGLNSIPLKNTISSLWSFHLQIKLSGRMAIGYILSQFNESCSYDLPLYYLFRGS